MSIKSMSSRPLTSQSMVSTGLIAPKSARGKTALRRQIQDKSYFIGLIRMKINELNMENHSLAKECEIMAKEEARIGVYRQKAETLARDLKNLTTDLLTYNEYVDRSRIDEQLSSIKEETNELKHENEAIIVNLENDYTKLRELESTWKANDNKLNEYNKIIASIKNRFNEAQIVEFNMAQTMNNDLSKDCHLLEQEIGLWRARKNALEETIIKEGNLVKIELIKAFTKLHSLEKQKNKLLNSNDSEENERKNLLAQVKRDNNYIDSVQTKINASKNNLAEVESEIEFYQDGDKWSKFSDLKQQEGKFSEFMNEYHQEKQSLLNQTETINNEITDTANKLSRFLKYLNGIKQIRDDEIGVHDVPSKMIIQKRQLELEINRSMQLKEKSDATQNLLTEKIAKLKEDTKMYSNIDQMKSKMENKLIRLKQSIEEHKRLIAELKSVNDNLNQQFSAVQTKLEKDEGYQKILSLEEQLASILKINVELQESDNSEMINEIKASVLDTVKKYNQSLIGF
ncbi:Spc7-like protein [Sarcoptes scabiei]|nr:Spc7-like protein [Sarcoptes scabiei]